MKVLGISGRDREAAAALAVDGRIVAAVTEDAFARVPGIGYAQTGGFPSAAAQACLAVAGLSGEDLSEIVVVDEARESDDASTFANASADWRSRRARRIDPVVADAQQAAQSGSDARTVIVLAAEPAALSVFERAGGVLGKRTDVEGAQGLVGAARSLASTLGLPARDPFATLDRLSLGANAEYAGEIGKAIGWDDRAGAIRIDAAELERATGRIAGEHASALADSHSLNDRVQQIRRDVAASFTNQVARVVSSVASRAASRAGSGGVVLGGSAFGNARLNTELSTALGSSVSLSFAAVPEASGRALGAVGTAAGAQASSGNGLALGPAFSDEVIKRTLDNCRLDYVYEPDWPRLLRRVSRMLAQGKVVGWFQGAMAFGPRPLGTRSILADPSNRYARQNMNEYLRNVPLDEPLPVAIAPAAAGRGVMAGSVPEHGVVDASVSADWRQPLAAALDGRHSVRVHGINSNSAHASPFGDLLNLHFESTGTPGLIETNLAGPGEPIACTPRDAVRTVYSSAIDALVIGRFLLMKDYWLLRTQDQ